MRGVLDCRPWLELLSFGIVEDSVICRAVLDDCTGVPRADEGSLLLQTEQSSSGQSSPKCSGPRSGSIPGNAALSETNCGAVTVRQTE